MATKENKLVIIVFSFPRKILPKLRIVSPLNIVDNKRKADVIRNS